MPNNSILFDDWQMRPDGVLKYRKRAYTFNLFSISVLLLFSGVGVFFALALLMPLILAIITITIVFLEWQKVKNNHLIIKSNQIEITNRFHKTTIYKVHIHESTLELRHSFNSRSGGIIMKFYDAKGDLICKYEDMFNTAAPWGFEKTKWEKGLEGLGIEIIDTSGIIKN